MKNTMEATKQALQNSVKAMNDPTNCFDVTIICTTDDFQAEFWMSKLKTDGTEKFPMVLAVSEDWNSAGGAGNGLGTLYAYQKACALAQKLHDVDLKKALAEGEVSAALYHTAGKGTRLAPLPASENNNKPGVNLPFGLGDDGPYKPITVLESVIKQTGIYADKRKGRLSVYWGDQVFIPSASFTQEPTHHVDIMCTLLPQAPTAQEWQDQGLDKYGVIACYTNSEGKVDAAQVEKVSHATATGMLEKLGSIQTVGPSLGSFSVSSMILEALCVEYSPELSKKEGKLDTDPHFWMPLTLGGEDYSYLMEQKGVSKEESKAHYERMVGMKAKLVLGDLGLFGAVNVGKEACWWDYGQVKLYTTNTRVLLEDNESAQLLRQFLGLDEARVVKSVNQGSIDEKSYLFGSKIGTGSSIANSLVANTQTAKLEATGAIVVNCAAPSIVAGDGAILYNVVSEDPIVADAGAIQVGVTKESGDDFVLRSRADIDGGKAWKIKVADNEMTFEEVHKANQNANIVDIQKKRQAKFDTVAAKLGF